MDIKFPMTELKAEDYGQVQLFGFKDYYKHYFTELIAKVTLFIFIFKYFYYRFVAKKK